MFADLLRLSAPQLSGQKPRQMDDAAIRSGVASNDARADAALRFAAKVATLRGPRERCRLCRRAGLLATAMHKSSEIVQHVALNSWTNYLTACFAPTSTSRW